MRRCWELARGNRRLFRRLADRLVNAGMSSSRNADILLDLLDPDRLRITPPRKELVLAWRTVMTAIPAEFWTPLVQRWLSALEQRRLSALEQRRLSASEQGRLSASEQGRPALEQGRQDDWLLHAPLLAAAGDDVLLNRLYVAARAWARQPPPDMPRAPHSQRHAREEISERFCREIGLVQGVDETDYGPETQQTTRTTEGI